MVESFITTQKNFFSDMEKRYIPKEHSSKYEEKKQEFLDLAKKYTKKWKELLKEVQDDERYQEGKDVVEKNLLKAKLHWENTIKKWKLIASDAKKKVKKMKK